MNKICWKLLMRPLALPKYSCMKRERKDEVLLNYKLNAYEHMLHLGRSGLFGRRWLITVFSGSSNSSCQPDYLSGPEGSWWFQDICVFGCGQAQQGGWNIHFLHREIKSTVQFCSLVTKRPLCLHPDCDIRIDWPAGLYLLLCCCSMVVCEVAAPFTVLPSTWYSTVHYCFRSETGQ